MVTNAHCIIDDKRPGKQYRLDPTAQAYVCCEIDARTSACRNRAKFNVLAWLSTRGYWFEPNKNVSSYDVNDGAVLFVQPATDQNMQPEPIPLHSFGRGPVPRVAFRVSGFPCREDDKERQGCSILTQRCVQHMGFDTNQAPRNARTTNGLDLQYFGDGCGGNSGGVVTTVVNQRRVAFAIVTGAVAKCTQDRSTIRVTQSVNQGRDHGVRLDLLSRAVSHGLPPPPR